MAEAFLGLGANLGDRRNNLLQALTHLSEAGLEVLAVSSIYESPPALVEDQPDFLNLVAHVRTALPPRGLLEACLGVEAEMGRVRERRWGPRNIDIDILLYDRLAIAEPDLTVPHPGLMERPFFLMPLLEIAPNVLLPDGEQVRTLALSNYLSGARVVEPPPLPPTDT